MPLPAVLAAKLAKRGILSDKQSKALVEEVIAENYDAPTQKKIKITPKQNEDDLLLAHKGHEGCPNKYNVHHECTTFCVTLWKIGVLHPDPKYLKRKYQLLKEYPLPDNWKDVYDRGCGRFYFWNMETNEVSWYPPKHPKFKISRSAAQLREMKFLKSLEEKETVADNDGQGEEEEVVVMTTEELRKVVSRKLNRNREEPLDPMDPAAYSDIPRGTWASGLENRAEAKTGADTTASGPLFQMRPYPSPGSVLAANARTKK